MRKTGSTPTPDQQRDIALKRAQLQERIEAFKRQAANILQAAPDGEDYAWDGTLGGETYFGTAFDGTGEEEDDEECPLSAEEHDQTPYSEIAPPMAMWMWSIFHCTSPHILDKAGAIEMLPKT